MISLAKRYSDPYLMTVEQSLLRSTTSGWHSVGNIDHTHDRSDERTWKLELRAHMHQLLGSVIAKLCLCFTEINSYKEVPLSTESEKQLKKVNRKTLVLDLDETLVHSCYRDPESNEMIGCNAVPESAQPDFLFTIPVLPHVEPIAFQVFKRPHVDEFLDFVGKWYNLVIYTASIEVYASAVVDKLDAGRGILHRRFYRQHCVQNSPILSKNLNTVCADLSSVFIIDNSPSAYRDFPDNAIPIKSYIYDLKDEELLNLLPFLDALRFTKDVRNILSRRLR